MAKNLLECLPHLTEQELDHITLALAASRDDYRALPREQLKWRFGLLSREEVRDALLKAGGKGLLPVGAAHAIACKHLGDQ